MQIKETKEAWDRYLKAKSRYEDIIGKITDLKDDMGWGRYYSRSGIPVSMPFLPSTKSKVRTMMELLGDIEGLGAADLGAGDGEVVLALAENKSRAVGFELEPELAGLAEKRLNDRDLKANIVKEDFFKADLSHFQVITVYGITSMMGDLEKKLISELPLGAKVVCNTFDFPNWRISKKKNSVYLYIKE